MITQSLLYEPEGSENPKSATATLRLRDGPPYASIALLSLTKVLLSSEKNWDNVMLNFGKFQKQHQDSPESPSAVDPTTGRSQDPRGTHNPWEQGQRQPMGQPMQPYNSYYRPHTVPAPQDGLLN